MRSAFRFGLLLWLTGAGVCQAQTAATLPPGEVVLGGAVTPAPEVQQLFMPASKADTGIWFRSDYVLWWVKPAPSSGPTVTTSPFNPNTFVPGVSPTPGALDNPSTSVLAGGGSTQFGGMSGFRLQGGISLDSDGIWAFEMGGFLLARRSNGFSAASGADGTPFLGSPFFNTATGAQGTSAVAFANDAANVNGGAFGGLNVVNALQLWGAEANLSARYWDANGIRADFLLGFRYLDLQETQAIYGNLSAIGQPLFQSFLGNDVAIGQTINIRDSFVTRNQFYGGQVGTRLFFDLNDRVTLDVLAKVALGGTRQTVSINGETTLITPGAAPVSALGGLYAQKSNIGTQTGDAFTVVPELGINLAYRVTPNVTFLVGYSFIYWSSVVRPGDQIDHNVDGRAIPSSPTYNPAATPTSPGALFNRSDFWAHGVNVGLEFRF